MENETHRQRIAALHQRSFDLSAVLDVMFFPAMRTKRARWRSSSRRSSSTRRRTWNSAPVF